MTQQVPLSEDTTAGTVHGHTQQVTIDLELVRLPIVNMALFGSPGAGDRQWVLIDAGIPGFTSRVMEATEDRFAKGARPAAIILTHGHFDHVGMLEALAALWDAPVYCHALERPYLDGTAAYPPPDISVGGGIMTLTAPLFPRGPVDVGARLHTLPADGSVPHMPGWQWLHTPGHAVGHVSLWREADRTLLSADAVITVAQESAYAVMTDEAEMHGPPAYFTQDWPSARASVAKLAKLEPELLVPGHGRAVAGPAMRDALHMLATTFDQTSLPEHARYDEHPARAEDGTAYIRKM
jgi:glyoxylase-like metal-dependent hydrolase (beta-lactamase superfamily II)